MQPWEYDASPRAAEPRYATADEMRRAVDLKASEGAKRRARRERQRRQGESVAHVIERAAVEGHRLVDEFVRSVDPQGRPRIAVECSCGWSSKPKATPRAVAAAGLLHLTEVSGVSVREVARGIV